MTLEIKQRMEQIENGDVPEGYKKTRIGVIPDAWEFKKLSQLLSFKNGINGERDKFGKGVKLISVRDILSDSPIYYHTVISQVDVTDNQLDEFGVTYGDILFQRSSENYEEAGTSNVYLDEENTAVFSGFVIRGKKCADYNPVYLNAVLKLPCVRKSIVRQAAGAQHVNIGQNSIANIGVPFASLIEQQKIAEILTTQDKVIELKERLIAEKQRQKKYLMQQLLTGKKRLQGFTKQWEFIRAKNIFRNVSDKDHDGTLEVLSATQDRGVVPRSQVDIDIKYDPNSLVGYKRVRIGDFVISLRSFQGGIEYSEYNGIVSPAYTVLQPSAPIIDDFYKFFFKSADYINKLSVAVYGIRDGKQISYNDFGHIEIPYPSIDEQRSIAHILASADREIEILQQELEQEKQKKKALMQLLLTGIVRVNV